MEDILQILFTIAIVTFALISNVRKRARKNQTANEEQGSEGEPLPEGWPSEGPLGEIFQELKRKKTTSQTHGTPRRMHPDSQELLTAEIETTTAQKSIRNDYSAGREPRTNTRTTLHTPTPSTNEREEGEKHPLTADFDAQKAVIWSEILKPKFEE